jgi:hypothetical protein
MKSRLLCPRGWCRLTDTLAETVDAHGCFRVRERLAAQGHVILALDGLQPDVVPLLEEVAGICQQLAISIAGVISDGQQEEKLPRQALSFVDL